MSTQKQIEANRLNALKSPGHRTAEGKAISSKNSFKHGLCVDDATLYQDPETRKLIESLSREKARTLNRLRRAQDRFDALLKARQPQPQPAPQPEKPPLQNEPNFDLTPVVSTGQPTPNRDRAVLPSGPGQQNAPTAPGRKEPS
jgi:hypothetical protein